MTADSEGAPAVLTIAGSDPSGGAGMQADLKTFAALGTYGMSVLTVITDCTTEGVADLQPLSASFVARQLDRAATDLRPQAVKTGMLFETGIIEAVTETVERQGLSPLGVDPVMTTRRGESLLSSEAVAAMCQLVGRATLVTPSRPEAEELARMSVNSRREVEEAAETIHDRLGPNHVFITGGHGDGKRAADLWFDGETGTWLEKKREPYAVHGAGDSFSAAVMAGLASGLKVETALRAAKAFVTEAIRSAPSRGEGNRPLAHHEAALAFRRALKESRSE